MKPTSIALLILALGALNLGGCVDREPTPTPTPEPWDAPVDPYGDTEGALSADAAAKLSFGVTSGQAHQAGQSAQWLFDAAKGGQFTIAVSTYAQGVPLYAALERYSGGGWKLVGSAAGVSSLQVGLTPGSDGSYRLSVSGGKAKQLVYAKLLCVKGICALPQCPTSPTLLAAQALGQLKRAVGSLQSGGQLKGVLYSSESDYPVQLVALVGAGKGTTAGGISGATDSAIAASELLQALGLPATTKVDLAWTPAKFWTGLQFSGMSPAQVALLQGALSSQANKWQVLRLGAVQVQVWLLGRSPCGALVGLRTTVIET